LALTLNLYNYPGTTLLVAVKVVAILKGL
jgi:hypothetical protein